MSFISMVSLVLLLFSGIMAAQGRIICEPKDLKSQLNYWNQKYNIKQLPIGFIAGIYHRASYRFPYANETRTQFEQDTDMKGQQYVHGIAIKHTNMVLPFKRTNNTIMFNFHQGDAGMVYVIDHVTGELITTELGFHSQIYFAVIRKGTWYAFEFPRHDNEEYALLGISVFRRRDNPMEIVVSSDPNELSKRFPSHEDLIRRLAQ